MSILTGSQSISEQLKPFTSSLNRIMVEYEKVMVEISKTLPEIEESISDNVMEARELLSFINSSSEHEDDYGIKHEFNQFSQELDHSIDIFKEIGHNDRALFENFKDSIKRSLDTIGMVKDISSISEDLKVFAINSIVFSNNIGIQGKGYQMISSEFIKISSSIGQKSLEIEQLGHELEALINQELMIKIDNHEEFSKKSVQRMSIDSKTLLDSAHKSLENFSSVLEDLLNRTEHVKDFIFKIMVLMQKQDIIHQQMGHMHESIEDILIIIRDYSTSIDSESHDEDKEYISILTLLHFLVVNSEKQMSRISKELILMVSEMESEFHNLRNSIQDIQADGTSFSEIVIDKKIIDEGHSILDKIFHAPKTMIKELDDTLSLLEEQKQDVTLIYGILVDKIQREKEYAEAFLPMVESIDNLLLLARIEKARYNLNISNLNDSSMGFSGSSMSALSSMVENIEAAYRIVLENLQKSHVSRDLQREKFGNIRRVLGDSINYIDNTEKLFQENYITIIDVSNNLFTEISQYIGIFDAIKNLNDEMLQNITVCSRIAKQVEEQLEGTGGIPKLDDCIFKDVILQKIVQKCTVEQERETLKEEFSELDIEESASSDITLF